MPRIVRIIVSTVLAGCGVVAPVEGISPVVVVVEPGGCGVVAPVEGISPAWATPESTHAKTTASVKCLILSFSFELRMPVYWH
jgi:hypothetical protein